jgi:hypothetical protein
MLGVEPVSRGKYKGRMQFRARSRIFYRPDINPKAVISRDKKINAPIVVCFAARLACT